MTMSIVRTQITVSQCAECPFFERSVASFVVDMLAKRERPSGTCKFNGVGQPFPIGRMQVVDEGTVPPGCPLKQGDVLVQLVMVQLRKGAS